MADIYRKLYRVQLTNHKYSFKSTTKMLGCLKRQLYLRFLHIIAGKDTKPSSMTWNGEGTTEMSILNDHLSTNDGPFALFPVSCFLAVELEGFR